jgi:MFS family permease
VSPENDPAAPSLARVLGSTAFATTAGVLPAFLVGSQAVQIQRDLDFGPALLGAAVAVSWAAAALFSPTMGRTAERVGGSRSLRTAAVVNGLVMLGIAALAQSWVVLAALIAVAGVGNALTQPAANVLMARTVAPERYGIAFAVKQSAMPFGTLVGGLAVPIVTLTLGWRWAFAFGGVLALAAASTIPGIRGSTGRTPRSPTNPSTPGTAKPILDTPLLLLGVFALGVGLGAAVASAQTTFLVSGAVESGLGEGVAGLLLTLGSALGIASRLLNGVRADVRGGGHLRVVAIMLIGGALACAMFALSEPWSYVLATPLAFAAGWAWPGLFNLAIVRANPAAPGFATSVTQTGTYIGAGAGPLAFGLVVGHGGYEWAWLATAAAALLAALAVAAGRGRLRSLGLATGRPS